MGDGSVQFVSDTVPVQTIYLMIRWKMH